MKNLKNSSDALQTDQKATEKDQALASKNILEIEKIINVEVGMLIKAKRNKQVHKIILIINKTVYYSEK